MAAGVRRYVKTDCARSVESRYGGAEGEGDGGVGGVVRGGARWENGRNKQLTRIQRHGTDVVVVEGAGGDAFDAQYESTGGVGTVDAGVGFHPVGGMVVALLGGEQGEGAGKGVQAKVGLVGKGEFAAAEDDGVADAHIAGAVAVDGFDAEGEVVELEMLGHERLEIKSWMLDG